MQYTIVSEIPGRIRVNLAGIVPDADAEPLRVALEKAPAIESARVYARIGSVALTYNAADPAARDAALNWLGLADAAAVDAARADCAGMAAPSTDALLLNIAELVGFHYARRWFLPAPIRAAWTVWSYRKFLAAGLRSLVNGRLDVPVLDAAAVGISFAKGDFLTAGSTMFLLNIGEALEDYTKARSQHELIYSLLAMPETARRIEAGEEVGVPSSDLAEGDLIVVRTGMPVCVDGTVERGRAMVNQAALTGEPLAVERVEGDSVFAGTACEDGEIFVRVTSGAGNTKLRSIVSMVEQSEGLKSSVQGRRERLADAIVPWNFLLAGAVALTTRSLVKTSAALMVDYSCALKLTSSISVLAAMSQSARAGFTVKGSRHFEQLAAADTIVFDKTGTLTAATPQLADVLAFAGWTQEEVLRFSACLEEHFPHPVARAVVHAAEARGLEHRERHAEVEYVVAHGIASSLDGKRVVIGSKHFVMEDEHVDVPASVAEKIDEAACGLSTLYLAVNGELVGALLISDPIKPGVAEAIGTLRKLGFEHIVMLTGDNEAAAARIAADAGITEFAANLLPEDKRNYVAHLREQGRRVVMVGDGVNDSPSLSAADVGVAMGNGTAIAREVADVTLNRGDLCSLVALRRLSMELMERMDVTFREVIGFNSTLLALGIAGAIAPQTSSLLHNTSTVFFSMRDSRAYAM
ncbi:heavy metal translocating P-type ATPase [uncultured Parolsenella sp.]|uniref:heavy metal translocating P-type ATPase n=1 Tax=uncultured Parolsenella sp. TaxID=2083008 RepID=UPI0025F869C4|nr:heavy metal translocating P-type ATPase [uncultured Parolsenella sp.]